jgi:hypothetical protein
VVDTIEDFPGILESLEQRPHATLLLGGKQVMAPRYRPRAFPETLETEHFTANGADELFAGTVP